MKKLQVRLGPETIAVECSTGEPLFEVLVRAGILLRSDCGGKGRCGKCAVQVTPVQRDSATPVGDSDRGFFSRAEIDAGYRLACRQIVTQDLRVDIAEHALAPREVTAKAPLDDLVAGRLTARRPLSNVDERWGLAVDLGTTTIAVYLCDLENGQVAGCISCRNPQSLFGEDVVTRITEIRQDIGVLKRMQAMAVRAVEWGAITLCRGFEVSPERIRRITAVGNSTMIHILLGENPGDIGVFPYQPLFTERRDETGDSLGFQHLAGARLQTLPLISGFLGADIVAAALAVDLPHREDGTLLVDLGTNGELLLTAGGDLYGTSCATGPALEGAAIANGMQAVSGAIDAVRIDRETGEPTLSILGADGTKAPRAGGICGSGVVSMVAELLRSGFLRPDGRFCNSGVCPRVSTGADGVSEYVFVDAANAAAGRRIALTQKDVRAIQLAKGALRAGIEFLCREVGLARPTRILLAGAFGTYIRRKDALTVGMLPKMPLADVRAVGNAAGAGGVLSLFDPEWIRHAAAMTGRIKVIDLASRTDFQQAFVEFLSFPK